MFGFEYDAANPAQRLVQRLPRTARWSRTSPTAPTTSTAAARASSTYTVRAVIGGAVGRRLRERHRVGAAVPAHPAAWSRPAAPRPSSCPTANEAYTYSANDASVGDLDGDGALRDHPQVGSVEREGQLAGGLHRQRLPRRLQARRHAPVAHRSRAATSAPARTTRSSSSTTSTATATPRWRCKTAPGTRDGTGAVPDDGPGRERRPTRPIYRNGDGYVLTGPEYLTVFNGLTGAEMATVDFDQCRAARSARGATTTATASTASWRPRRTSTTPGCPASSWRAATTRARR